MQRGSLFVALFLSNIGTAQVNFGIKVGLNLADIRSDATFPDAIDYKFIPSWHIGMLVGFTLSERFDFQPELLLSQLGGQAELGITDLKNTMTYINIPMLISYKIGPLAIEAGSGIGYLLDSKAFVNKKKNDFALKFDEKINFFINAGIKYSFKKIFTQLRWKHGLLPIGELGFTDVNGEPVGNESFYNTAIQVSVGYQL